MIVLLMNTGTTPSTPTIPLATVVTRKGQITIPAPIRAALGIKQGDSVTFQVEGEAVTLKPTSSTLAAGYQSIPALNRPLSEREIEEVVRDDRAEVYKKNLLHKLARHVMKFFDTTIIIRYLTRDDPEKAARAYAFLQEVEKGNEIVTTTEAIIMQAVPSP